MKRFSQLRDQSCRPKLREMNKDASILSMVDRLDLERRGWVIVDHWDSDQMALGIARTNDLRRLVYVSTFNRPGGQYYFECEEPAGTDETEFRVSTSRGHASFEELLSALEQHLESRC